MTHAEFVVSALAESDFPSEGIPEIAFAGRSNVGKSSLINRLAMKKGLARTSATPGKTKSINFYRLDRSFFFVDLPGYGYAKSGKTVHGQWKHLVERYFRDRPAISLVIQLVDARMPPKQLDIELVEWLGKMEIAYLIVATKVDKLSYNKRVKQSQVISQSFGGEEVIFSSALTGMGCKEIWKRVVEAAYSK